MTKIMLVEDDNNLREIYEARLLAEGYTIVSASDGEAGLAMAVKEKPDLIICDVMMPKISGFDMLDILRSTPDIKDTKIIMMTALSQAEDKARAERLGADRYLVKSQVTLEDVARVVSEVLNDEPVQELGAPVAAAIATDATPNLAPQVDPPAIADSAPATPAVVEAEETPIEEPVVEVAPVIDVAEETPTTPMDPVEVPDTNVEDVSDTAPVMPETPETPAEEPNQDIPTEALPIASDPESHQPIVPISEPADDTSSTGTVASTDPATPTDDVSATTDTQSTDDGVIPMVIEPPILPVTDEGSDSIPVTSSSIPVTDDSTSIIEPVLSVEPDQAATNPETIQPEAQVEPETPAVLPTDTTQETPSAPSDPVEVPDTNVDDSFSTAPVMPETPDTNTTLPPPTEESSLPPPTEHPEVLNGNNVQIAGKKTISPISDMNGPSVDLNALLAQEEAKEAASGTVLPQQPGADNNFVQPDQTATPFTSSSSGSPSDIAL
ncbi:MAG: response regulator [Candidatus Saccharimonadales bacterium]